MGRSARLGWMLPTSEAACGVNDKFGVYCFVGVADEVLKRDTLVRFQFLLDRPNSYTGIWVSEPVENAVEVAEKLNRKMIEMDMENEANFRPSTPEEVGKLPIKWEYEAHKRQHVLCPRVMYNP